MCRKFLSILENKVIERDENKLNTISILEMQRINYMKYTYAQTDQ